MKSTIIMRSTIMLTFLLMIVLQGGGGSEGYDALGIQGLVAGGNTYYVATTGDDNNPGTLDEPWRLRRRRLCERWRYGVGTRRCL